MVRNENYINIQGWMVNELGLKGNDLMVYAIIYGFTQDGQSSFSGSLQYLADWCNSTKQGVQKNLKNLIEKGLLVKSDFYENNVKYVEYYTTELQGGMQQSCIGYTTKLHGGMQQSCMGGMQQSCINNIDKETIEENIEDKEDIVENFLKSYNDTCTNLPSVRRVTDKRRKAIQKMFKKFTQEEIQTVLQKANGSDFLTGKNDRGWKADIDFLLREDKFISILEGKYDSNGKSYSDRRKFAETSNVKSKKVTQEDIKNGYFTNNIY